MATQSAVLLPTIDTPFLNVIEPKINLEGSFSSQLNESVLFTPNNSTISEKKIASKLELFYRLGIGSRLINSMTKEDVKKMSILFEAERRESFDEEDPFLADLTIKKSYSNIEGDFSLNFLEKTDDEVRQAYLNKLINMKILKLGPIKKHQEIIIFDWDDTLICTSHLTKLGLTHLSEEMFEDLKALDEKVFTLLDTATSFGKTCIVTNAELHWVNYTGMAFLPNSFKLIQEKVEIISARSKYQNEFPGDNFRWKNEAFQEFRKTFDDSVIANIMVIGDSRAEIEAARNLGSLISHSLIKTVKFKSNPGIRDLTKQINLLIERFEQIITNKTSLTIRLEKKPSSS